MQTSDPPCHRQPLGDAIADAAMRQGAIDPLAALRDLVAARETPADRLFARYCGRPARRFRSRSFAALSL